MASKLNLDVKTISDEHEIELSDNNDRNKVNEYNKRLKSLGWVNDGKIYLNLPNIESIADLEKTAVHESVTHAGLRKIFGNRMNEFLEEVYKKADRGVLKGIDEVREKRYDADGYEIMEEYLAKLTEKDYPTQQERGVISRFKDFIKNMLVRQNIYTGKNRKITEKELEAIMRQHLRYRMRNATYDSYLKDVYGRFESSRYPAAEYHNENNYLKSTRDKIVNNEYMRFVGVR